MTQHHAGHAVATAHDHSHDAHPQVAQPHETHATAPHSPDRGQHHDHHGGHAGHGGGHDKHAGHDPEQFRRKFWLSLALTLPIVLTSHMVMDWLGYS
ncbi:heavy metal translocating P-type ATPase, partial [Micromonospora chersina]